MHARAIGRWVGRAALFAALSVGIWAMAGLASADGSATALTGEVASDSSSDFFGPKAPILPVVPLEFDWN
ncbi:MAG TPA: hypothetical protein VIL44_00655 [Micromonospora sp.]